MFLSPLNSKENTMKYRIIPLLTTKWAVEQSKNGKNWSDTGKDFDHENEAEGWIEKEIERARIIKKRISDHPPREYPSPTLKLVD